MSITLTEAQSGQKVRVSFDAAFKVQTMKGDGPNAMSTFTVFYTDGSITTFNVIESDAEIEILLEKTRGAQLRGV